MKNVTFQQIELQNFLSVGSTPLVLNYETGINFITGENKDKGGRNGVGKTTILEGIYWVLFGETLRDLKTEQIINNVTKKEAKGVLTLLVNDKVYVITRKANKNSSLTITEDTKDITLSTIVRNNEFIINLVGSPTLFKNSIILSTTGSIPFFAQKKIDKRKFLEGIFNLEVFSLMLGDIRTDYNETKKSFEVMSSRFQEKSKTLTMLTEQSSKFEENKQKQIEEVKKSIADLQKQIEELKQTDSDTTELKTSIQERKLKREKIEAQLKILQNEKSELTETRGQLNAEIKHIDNEIKALTQKQTSCPTCKRPFDNTSTQTVADTVTTLQAKKVVQTEKLDVLTVSIKSKNDLIEKADDFLVLSAQQIRKLENTVEEKLQIQHKISKVESSVANYLQNIEKIRESTDPNVGNINQIKVDIELLSREIEDTQKRMAILDNCKYVVSEEGVKPYIIKDIIALLNTTLNSYLTALNAPTRCVFNEQFEEQLFNEKGDECSYFSFSGGERKRIDLAVLFTFQDLHKSQTHTNYNVSMYDELFDSALDAKGVQSVINIFLDRIEKYKECIYIISHNLALSASENITKTIYLEKRDGITSIV